MNWKGCNFLWYLFCDNLRIASLPLLIFIAHMLDIIAILYFTANSTFLPLLIFSRVFNMSSKSVGKWNCENIISQPLRFFWSSNYYARKSDELIYHWYNGWRSLIETPDTCFFFFFFFENETIQESRNAIRSTLFTFFIVQHCDVICSGMNFSTFSAMYTGVTF